MTQRTTAEEALRKKAEFCLGLGIAPSEYDRMSLAEVNAFVEVHNEIQKKQNKK